MPTRPTTLSRTSPNVEIRAFLLAVHVASHHGPYERTIVGLCGGALEYRTAVAQHDHAVGDLTDLVESV